MEESSVQHVKSVWFVAREYRGIAGAGGVQDVSRALAEALARKGLKVRVILPCYGFLLDPGKDGFVPYDVSLDVDMDYVYEARRERVDFLGKRLNGVDVMLVRSPRFLEKLDVYTYTAREETSDPARRKGEGHGDYFAMNILHQKATLSLSLFLDEKPDVFHCHDGHTACLPAMMSEIEWLRHAFRRTGAVVTIHNAGMGYHQDVADLPFVRTITGLPWKTIHGSLLHGSFDPFLAAAACCPVNTVSEQYAHELQHSEMDAMTGWLGHTLKDRGIGIAGITNGIDPGKYDPTRPDAMGLPAGFDPGKGDLAGKNGCRRRFFEILRAGVPGDVTQHGYLAEEQEIPLFTLVGRLTEQKGIDILAGALKILFDKAIPLQMAILGSGKDEIESSLVSIAESPVGRGRLVFLSGYSPALSNLMFAAGDFSVMPSRYEPCGLTDFIAQLLGNVPIVHATGGLVKVIDGFSGFSYKDNTPSGLAEAMERAISVYGASRESLAGMIANAVSHIRMHYTWDTVAERYLELYGRAVSTL